MPAATDVKRKRLTDKVLPLNYRIALAKGWKLSEWYEEAGLPETRSETPLHTHWRDPSYQIATLPDFVGTLEGVSGMLRELLECSADVYLWAPQMTGWMCVNADWSQCWGSDLDHPGYCVGDAWLSVFGKETDDA